MTQELLATKSYDELKVMLYDTQKNTQELDTRVATSEDYKNLTQGRNDVMTLQQELASREHPTQEV